MINKPNPEHVPHYRDEAARGNAAKLIMDNPVFKDIAHDMRENLIKAWLHTDPKDFGSREWFYQQALAQQAVINAFNTAITTGKMADMSLKDLEARVPSPRRRK